MNKSEIQQDIRVKLNNIIINSLSRCYNDIGIDRISYKVWHRIYFQNSRHIYNTLKSNEK